MRSLPPLACRGEDLQVLPSGQMAVEPGLVDDRTDSGQGLVAMVGDRVPSSDIVPASAWVSPSSTRMSVVLPAPLGPDSQRRIPGDEELDAVHGDVVTESLGQPMGLDGPAALGTLGSEGTGSVVVVMWSLLVGRLPLTTPCDAVGVSPSGDHTGLTPSCSHAECRSSDGAVRRLWWSNGLAAPMVRRRGVTQRTSTRRCGHDGGIGDDLDFCDRVADDVEGKDRPRAPTRSPYGSRGAFDEGELGRGGPPRHGHRHRPGAAHTGRQKGCSLVAVGGRQVHRGAVHTENGVGVEQRDQRLEVPPAGGGQERFDHFLLASPISRVHVVAALHGRRARLAICRVAATERPTIGAMFSNGTANRSWSTKARRSEGVKVSSTRSSAGPIVSARTASSSGVTPSGSGSSGTSGSSRRVRREPEHPQGHPGHDRRQPPTEVVDSLGVRPAQADPPFLHRVLSLGERPEHPVGQRL